MLKGQATFVFTDKNTGEVTQVRQENNFVFSDRHTKLWTDASISRIVIDNPGTVIYPRFSKHVPYFGYSGSFLAGYAPTGTMLKRFFPKTTDSPAYYEYYSVFLPPGATRAISAICLVSSNITDNTTDSWSSSSVYRDGLRTAINLNPPCFQSPTEYLNIYYRLIMLDDEDDDIPDFIKNEMVLDIDRGSTGNGLFPKDNFSVYPFRITEPIDNVGNLNFLSGKRAETANRQTIIPTDLNDSLQYARKTWAYPSAAPNQYAQIPGEYVKSTMRGGKNPISFTEMHIRPETIVPEIGEGTTGIGNVFATSASSNSDYFDPAFFPIGSGKMFASGQWDPEPLPKKIVCEIQQTGQYAADATYRIYKYHTPGAEAITLPLFPHVYGLDYTYSYADMKNKFSDVKAKMYKGPSKVHYSQYMRTWIKERAFITWDSNGITIYDVYMGKLTSFDASTTPQLNVTDIRDVKVAPNGDIYIACANFGLYRLRIVEETVTLTRIGQFPGSQQRCYAVDIDNQGNVYGVFWGQGLYYSIDGGESWINAIISYAPFSDYDEEGTNSKWRFCTRVVCNPNRNAADGVAQVLLLLSTSSPDNGTTAGCWWDQQNSVTVGITNTSLRSSLATVRTARPKENFAISNLQDKWYFANTGSGADGMVWMPFLHNAAVNTVSGNSRSSFAWNCLHMDTVFDHATGTFKEYIYNGPWWVYTANRAGPSIIDVATNAVIKQLTVDSVGLDYSGLSSADSNCVYFGKNSRVCFEVAVSSDGSSDRQIRVRYTIRRLFPLTKEWRQWSAEFFGWDGGNWVKWHLGTKVCNEVAAPFERGVSVRFANGPVSTESFHEGDQYTFHLYDGLYKDNATKLDLKDTIYFKPKNDITVFDPPTVQLVDRSSQVGILNSADINIDWNIDKLPDTTYDGTQLTLNGDALWGNVTYLNYFDDGGIVDQRYGEVPTVTGAPAATSEFLLFGKPMTYFDGESGLAYPVNARYSPGSNAFTFEGFFVFEQVGGVLQFLLDHRQTNSHSGAIALTVDGKIGFWNGSSYLGNTGPTLNAGQLYHIQVSRIGNNIECAVDGTVMWSAAYSSSITVTNEFRLMRGYAQFGGSWQGFKGWVGGVRYTVGVNRYSGNFTVPTSKFPNTGNIYSGARLKLSGNYNEGGIFAKKELVGNWSVIFRDLDSEMRRYEQGRPILAFGISTTNRISTITDIGYRIISRGDGLGYERWLNPHSTSDNSALNSLLPRTIPNTVNMIRFDKANSIIRVYHSSDFGVSWTIFRQFEDLAPVHYICMYQVQPYSNFRTPSVEILSNGADYFTRVGDPINTTGMHHPKFLAIDCYWEHDLKINLNGTPVTKTRSNYQDQMLPLEGECYAHQHGTIRFHPNDAGKTITGKVIAIRD